MNGPKVQTNGKCQLANIFGHPRMEETNHICSGKMGKDILDGLKMVMEMSMLR